METCSKCYIGAFEDYYC